MCVVVNNFQMQIKNAKQTIYEVMSGKLVKQVYKYHPSYGVVCSAR